MIRRRFLANPLFALRFQAPDTGENATTGAAPGAVETDSQTKTPADPAADLPPSAPAATAPPKVVQPPKLGVMQTVKAALANTAALQTSLAAMTTQRDELIAALATRTTERDEANSQLTSVQAKLSTATADVVRLTNDQRTVAETVAQLGFPLADLPEQIEGPVAHALDDLQTAYAAEKDPEKKAQIYERIQDARAAEKAATAKK